MSFSYNNKRKIKVALINNMNNNFFAFARYLRDLGIEAHLYINKGTPKHFLPNTDTFKNIDKDIWIHDFPYSDTTKDWIFTNNRKVKNILSEYDIIISCGVHIAYLERAGIRSDIIIPYGADLLQLPFRKFKLNIKTFFYQQQAIYQKKGFKSARCVTIETSSSFYREPLEKINIKWVSQFMPMLYNKENIENVDILKYIDEKIIFQLENSEFIVFNHSRQIWATNTGNLQDFNRYLGLKRNDKVIKAFAQFKKETELKKPLLILFEYGDDVENSKNLIESLGIDSSVIWIPKSPRKVILFLLQRYATFGTGTFRENLWAGFNGVAYEVLSSGVPFITHMENTVFFKSSPAIEALSVDDIYNIFKDYEYNPNKYIKLSYISRNWFDENLGLGLAKKYMKLIYLLNNNKDISLYNSSKIYEIIKGTYEK